MHKVICYVCGQTFDRDKVQAVKVNGRRYAHAACCPENTDLVPMTAAAPANPDLEKLKSYISSLFGESCNWPLTMKYIKKYTEEDGYSYSGILKSLVYFYEVKGNPVSKKDRNSIGIVPFVYKDAYNYYYSIFLAKQQNQEKDISLLVHKTKEVTIKPPKIKKKIKLFNFEEGEAEDGE